MATVTEFDTKWFQRQLAGNDLTQRRAAELLGMEQAALSLTLNGKRLMRMNEAARFAEILRQPVEEVLRRAGARVPASTAAETSPVAARLLKDGEIIQSPTGARAVAPERLPPDAIAARSEDPEASYFGWTIFYRPVRGEIEPDAIGRLSVVENERGRFFLRYLRHSFEPGMYQLNSVSGDIVETVRVASASPVLWIKP